MGFDTISGSAISANVTWKAPPQGTVETLNTFVDLVIPTLSILSDLEYRPLQDMTRYNNRTSVDDKGNEHNRGLKTLLIPAHYRSNCRNIEVRCIKFVLPEELDVSGTAEGICNHRNFKAKFIANYVDSDFECCDQIT